MKQTWKSFFVTRLSLLLAVVLLVGMLPLSVSAEEAELLPAWEDREGISGVAFEEVGTKLDSYTITTEEGVETVTVDHSALVGSKENPISIPDERALICFGLQAPEVNHEDTRYPINITIGKHYILDKADGVYDMDGEHYRMFPLFSDYGSDGCEVMELVCDFKGTLIGNDATVKNVNLRSVTERLGADGLYDVPFLPPEETPERITMYLTDIEHNYGLFGGISNAVVSDLTVDHIVIRDAVEELYSQIGGLAGNADASSINNITIRNATIQVDEEKDETCIGGAVGVAFYSYLNDVTVTDTTISVSNAANATIGGIAGAVVGYSYVLEQPEEFSGKYGMQNCTFDNAAITVVQSESTGEAGDDDDDYGSSEITNIGGLVGMLYGEGHDLLEGTPLFRARNSYASFDVQKDDNIEVGGLIGWVRDSLFSLENCYYEGNAPYLIAVLDHEELLDWYEEIIEYSEPGDPKPRLICDLTHCYYPKNADFFGYKNNDYTEVGCDSFEGPADTVLYGETEVALVEALNAYVTAHPDSGMAAWLYNKAAYPTLKPVLYAVRVQGDHATIYQNGTAVTAFTVNHADAPTVLIRPEGGYRVKKLTLNGTDITSRLKGGYVTLDEIMGKSVLTVETEPISEKPVEQISRFTVEGTVTRNGVPVAGVTVELHSTPRTTVTDADGKFSFADVESDRHTLTVFDPTGVLGYAEFTIDIGDAASYDKLADGSYLVTVPAAAESASFDFALSADGKLDISDFSATVKSGGDETDSGNHSNSGDVEKKSVPTWVWWSLLFLLAVALIAVAFVLGYYSEKKKGKQ